MEHEFSWSRYFDWLVSKIGGGHKSSADLRILKFLFDKEFVWFKELDSNRADDGRALRSRYFKERYGDDELPDIDTLTASCTVLEALAAIALNIEEDVVGVPGDYHPDKWFWMMIDNLGLEGRQNPRAWSKRLRCWMDGAFSPSGKGSPFRTKSGKDMASMDIWTQAMTWVSEEIRFW